ncbi:MAG: hypothetical protein COV67_02195 [Nitrospinae bacterium CG11_big_fil_rev_8_21_14_0_20_56_8]|nr:MAG: hypothetical protein COV67_02195 [Nitrospinae bacterium CG11_big_fil_rev_8_21_14_0_20_56_8]
MKLVSGKITRIKVIDIMEESAEAIEKMVNGAIDQIHGLDVKILDIQVTDNNIFLILGEKET